MFITLIAVFVKYNHHYSVNNGALRITLQIPKFGILLSMISCSFRFHHVRCFTYVFWILINFSYVAFYSMSVPSCKRKHMTGNDLNLISQRVCYEKYS